MRRVHPVSDRVMGDACGQTKIADRGYHSPVRDAVWPVVVGARQIGLKGL
ncbi:MAG: hypothetical protein ACE5JU_17690 [Candidatus Binatia bacterium]